ncbi:MAG: hypothetical protein ACFFBV_14010 [Promethearchaeota archaeon]
MPKMQLLFSLTRDVRTRLFLSVLIIYVYFINGFNSPNEGSRLALTMAIVEQQSLKINDFMEWTWWIDYSEYPLGSGNYYSDKAPGLSFLGIPFYFLGRFVAYRLYSDPLLINGTLASFVVICGSIFTALSVVVVFELCKLFKISEKTSLLTALSYAFGTIAFVYGKTFFAHGTSAFLLISAAYLTVHYFQNGGKDATKVLLAGLALGYSVCIDYQNFLALPPILAFYTLKRDFRKLAAFLVSYVACLGLLAWYHYAAFGNPFSTPYNYTGTYGDVQSTLAFSYPIYLGLFGLLFSTYRGLFYLSPFLLFGVYGFVLFFRRFKYEAIWFASTFLLMLFVLSMYVVWYGGGAYGPRLLLSVIPFIVVPIGMLLDNSYFSNKRWFQVLFFATLAYSVFAIATGAVTDPVPYLWIQNPFLEYNLPLLIEGNLDSALFKYISPYTILLMPILLLIINLRQFHLLKLRNRFLNTINALRKAQP